MPHNLSRTFKSINSLQVELIRVPPERKMLSVSEGYLVFRITVRMPKANCIIHETFFPWNERQRARDHYDGAVSMLS